MVLNANLKTTVCFSSFLYYTDSISSIHLSNKCSCNPKALTILSLFLVRMATTSTGWLRNSISPFRKSIFGNSNKPGLLLPLVNVASMKLLIFSLFDFSTLSLPTSCDKIDKIPGCMFHTRGISISNLQSYTVLYLAPRPDSNRSQSKLCLQR